MIGRKESDKLVFTSQSGKAAVHEIIQTLGLPITVEEAAQLQPVLKTVSEEKQGELSNADIKDVYFNTLVNVNAPLVFSEVKMNADQNGFAFKVIWNGEEKNSLRKRNRSCGCLHACREQIGLYFHLIEYTQQALDPEGKEFAAEALSEIKLQRKANGSPEGPVVIGRGRGCGHGSRPTSKPCSAE